MATNESEKIHTQLQRLRYKIHQSFYCAIGGVPLWQPPINLLKGGGKLILCMDISGVNKNEISVRAENKRLLISGFRKFPEPKDISLEKEWGVYLMEIDYGYFERVIELPEEIEPEYVKAEYRDGVLWVIMPLVKKD